MKQWLRAVPRARGESYAIATITSVCRPSIRSLVSRSSPPSSKNSWRWSSRRFPTVQSLQNRSVVAAAATAGTWRRPPQSGWSWRRRPRRLTWEILPSGATWLSALVRTYRRFRPAARRRVRLVAALRRYAGLVHLRLQHFTILLCIRIAKVTIWVMYRPTVYRQKLVWSRVDPVKYHVQFGLHNARRVRTTPIHTSWNMYMQQLLNM